MRRLSPLTSQQLHVLVRTCSAELASQAKSTTMCTHTRDALFGHLALLLKHQAMLWMANACVGRCLCPTKALQISGIITTIL